MTPSRTFRCCASAAFRSAAGAAYLAADSVTTGAQVAAFERGVPTARVVRLPGADHYVFVSDAGEVLRAIRAFIGGLPTPSP